MGWRRRLDPQLVDIGLVVAVVLASTLTAVGTAADPTEASPMRWVLAVAAALPLLARRKAPEAVLIAIALLAVLPSLVLREMPGFGTFLALLIGSYSVGAHAALGPGLAAVALCLGAVTLVGAVFEPLSTEGVAIPFVYLGGAWGLGRLVGSRSARAEQLASETRRLVAEQAEREQAILSEERARISRELHDLIAHAVTTMVLQAGAAQAELSASETATRNRLTTIESSGRQALDELRRVLAVMREPHAIAAREPMPGIGDLRALAERTSEAGVAVDLSVEVGDELPAGMSLAVYRIVQEALTNVLRHASATRASVRVGVRAGAVTVEVADDGDGQGSPLRSGGSGRGLIGMRERAAVYGGTLEAGPHEGGGFHVRAELPLAEGRR